MKARQRRPPQARRLHTEERILDAFETVLSEQGLRGLSLNAIVAEAGISKPLIYRYFDGLSGLISAWNERRGMFLDPASDGKQTSGDSKDFKALIERDLLHVAEHLRRAPVTLEFLAGELTGHSEHSAAFNAVRRRIRYSRGRQLMRDARYAEPENQRLIVLLYAAITHLALRARHAPNFMGVDLASEAGWQQIMDFVRGLCADARLAAEQRAAKGRKSEKAIEEK